MPILSSLFGRTRKKSKSKSKSNSFTRKRHLIATQFASNIRQTIKRRKTLESLRKKSSARKIQKSFKAALEKTLDNDVCSICLSKMLFPSLTTILPCGHKFHAKCIKPVIDNTYNARCPLCRAPIVTRPLTNQTTNQATNQTSNQASNQTNIGSRQFIYRLSNNRHRTRQSSRRANIARLHTEWLRLNGAATDAQTRWRNQRHRAVAARERVNRANFFNRTRLTQIAYREELLETTYLTERNRRITERTRFETRHRENIKSNYY